jgi:hypothetical protein
VLCCLPSAFLQPRSSLISPSLSVPAMMQLKSTPHHKVPSPLRIFLISKLPQIQKHTTPSTSEIINQQSCKYSAAVSAPSTVPQQLSISFEALEANLGLGHRSQLTPQAESWLPSRLASMVSAALVVSSSEMPSSTMTSKSSLSTILSLKPTTL